MKSKFVNLDKKTIKNIISKSKTKKKSKTKSNQNNNNNNNDDNNNKEEIKVMFYLSPKTKKNMKQSEINEITSRLKTLYIPKHLNNLQIAKSPKNRVQIIGQDDKGRQQYFYAKEYADKSESRKYKTLKNLSLIINKLEQDNLRKLISLNNKLHKYPNYNLVKDDAIELINYFLLYHHIRIGNKQYLDTYGSTGISTLQVKHFKFINNKKGIQICKIKFKGKKGVINHCEIKPYGNDIMDYNLNNNTGHNNDNNDNNDNNTNNSNKIKNIKDVHYYIINILKKLSQQKSNNQFILDYSYFNPITNSKGRSIVDTNDYKNYYLDKYRIDITPKMFRTWFANYYLVNYITNNHSSILQQFKQCNTKGEKRKYTSQLNNDIITQISNNLNNTPEICKKKYINNKFLKDVLSRLNYYCKTCSKLQNNNHIKQRQNIHNFIIKHIF